jgi:hypothetical protein
MAHFRDHEAQPVPRVVGKFSAPAGQTEVACRRKSLTGSHPHAKIRGAPTRSGPELLDDLGPSLRKVAHDRGRVLVIEGGEGEAVRSPIGVDEELKAGHRVAKVPDPSTAEQAEGREARSLG